MPDYDRINFDPPAPVALVTVRNPQSGEIVADIRMLIDSGADITLLPDSVLDTINLSEERSTVYELAGFDDSRSLSSVVKADIVLLGQTFSGRFLLMAGPYGILGRNV